MAKTSLKYNPRDRKEKSLWAKRDHIPKEYERFGRVWWKGQEMEYMLRPSKMLNAAVAARKAELGLEENAAIAGMHIRRGDKVKGCQGSGMCAKHMYQQKEAEAIPTRHFMDAMKQLLSQASVVGAGPPKLLYVSTDDAAALTDIDASSHEIGLTLLNQGVQKMRHYDERKKDGGYSDEQHTIGALVEMELLAHADPIVFTFSSAFGGVAFVRNFARTGGCMGGWASLENGKTFVPRAFPRELYPLCRAKAGNNTGATFSFNEQTLPKLCELDAASHQFFGRCLC
jgi:hypothetical protein